jgi:hypothetical protein
LLQSKYRVQKHLWTCVVISPVTTSPPHPRAFFWSENPTSLTGFVSFKESLPLDTDRTIHKSQQHVLVSGGGWSFQKIEVKYLGQWWRGGGSGGGS